LDHGTWDALTEELSDFHCVAPDLPGFGESEKPPASRFAYGIESFVDSIVDLYAALGLGPVTVVGHGLGGALGIVLAARHRELVSKLVLVDALCHQPPSGLQARLAALPVVGGLVLRQLWGKRAFRSYFRSAFLAPGSTVAERRIDRYYELYNTPAARGSALATLRAMADPRAIVAQTTRIETPTLAIWGTHDRVHPPALGQRLAREIRGCGFELLDAGHLPQEERPLELAAVIRRFLAAERPLRRSR
jgi:pimeloyl-ACP methyl ester carboxylesterase